MRATQAKPRSSKKAKEQPDNAAALRLTQSALRAFQHIVKLELLFHTLFIGRCLCISSRLYLFLFFFIDIFSLGIFIAYFFFAIVLYFVLKLYFQEQKPTELLQLRDIYLNEYKLSEKMIPKTFRMQNKHFCKTAR